MAHSKSRKAVRSPVSRETRGKKHVSTIIPASPSSDFTITRHHMTISACIPFLLLLGNAESLINSLSPDRTTNRSNSSWNQQPSGSHPTWQIIPSSHLTRNQTWLHMAPHGKFPPSYSIRWISHWKTSISLEKNPKIPWGPKNIRQEIFPHNLPWNHQC